jgi:pimeloyl-ACP methyl ester carboxylesterase
MQPQVRSNTKEPVVKSAVAGSLILLLCVASAAVASSGAAVDDAAVRHRTVDVRGVKIFYREAGRVGAPVILLLHGFPSSSFMYRSILGPLGRDYHVIAPDYPGFGQSDFPSADRYEYSFENLAQTMARFIDALGVKRYAMYVQDYGAPIGFRMALADPKRVTAMVVQNGNAYEEGLSSGWDPLRAYWAEPSAQNREAVRGWLTREGIRQQYLAGVPAELHERFAPETWTLDWALLQRAGNIDVQLDLFRDYRHNVTLYGAVQRMFREQLFPTLIVWGKHDVFFTPAGARAYLRDLPDAELHWLEAGHFALETHHAEIVLRMRDFLLRRLSS